MCTYIISFVSWDIKTTIKEKVIANMGEIYEIVLQLNEKRQVLARELEQVHKGSKSESARQEKEQLKAPNYEPDSSEMRRVAKKASLKDDTNKSEQILVGINNIKDQISAYRDEVKEVTHGLAGGTYAEVLKQKKRPHAKELHSIIVTSETEKDYIQDVINKIREAVNAKESGIRVDKIRKARDQKVIISCEKREDLKKVQEKIEGSGARLRAKEAKNKDPLIILKDVLKNNTDEDIQTALKTQNRHLLQGLPTEECRATIRYRRKARNPHKNHVVLQVSPALWERITSAGRVQVDLQQIKVFDQSPLVKCSRCLCFGHGRKLCQESVDLCSHCAGPHMWSECPH